MAPPLRFPRLQWFYPQQPTDDDLPKLNPIDCSADAPVPCNDITSNSDRFRWWWAFGGNRYDAETGDAFFCCHRRSDKICRIIWCSFQTTGFSFYLQSLSLSHRITCGGGGARHVSRITLSPRHHWLTDWLSHRLGFYQVLASNWRTTHYWIYRSNCCGRGNCATNI